MTIYKRGVHFLEAPEEEDAGPRRREKLSLDLMHQESMRRLNDAADAAALHMKPEPQAQDYDDAEVVGRRP